LNITVVLCSPQNVTPPLASDYPIVQGRITHAKGVLGAFEFTLDDYALPNPASRNALRFTAPRNGASATSDIFIDISGDKAFFPAHELREGYLRAAPNDKAALEALKFKAAHLVGTFDKPYYIDFTAELCAHSRSKITGCTRCLDLCPTGAISPNGDSVAIDAAICAGCGACAAACPTGAASYSLPSSETLLRKIQVLLATYQENGGQTPTLLFHDEAGEELIALCARFGTGLPARVLPVRVNELSQLGIEVIAASFAYGAAAITLLTREKYKHTNELHALIDLAEPLLSGLGFGEGLVRLLQTDDPSALIFTSPLAKTKSISHFVPRGHKRGLLELSFKELHAHAPTPKDAIALPAKAPFGKVVLNEAACTLCLSCVSACPVAALTDNSEQPMLRFTESLCLQCGLCAQTCPEDALTLTPQVDFVAWQAPKRILKQEEPFHCVSCAKPFGVKSTIEKVQEKLKSHWMFTGDQAGRLRTLAMCEDCRVTSVMNESFDPHAKQRPKPRTAEDYQ
jgi:ferredoxin